jgi:hypothetical protein
MLKAQWSLGHENRMLSSRKIFHQGLHGKTFSHLFLPSASNTQARDPQTPSKDKTMP